ncbi:unnamed protein product [Clavelina lepadiformis]|uniref:Uncharacterized protein n=1 Tax=Clavelina lepadiformis TaxID=159417 RepID=A0ABP0FIN5_CLALP
MIGRADIEGSKSNVAMNAWLPQASYPCVGFPESVPVLSQLFDAGRKRAGARVSCGIPREETDTGPGSRPPPDGSRSSPSPVQPRTPLRASARPTQPLEPILFPKLRI